MTLEQALLKIIELQQEIINLKNQQIQPVPYTINPFIYVPPDLCTDQGFHDYPNPWFGTVPPSCKKCGKQMPSSPLIVTCSTKASNE